LQLRQQAAALRRAVWEWTTLLPKSCDSGSNRSNCYGAAAVAMAMMEAM
jgi:hypothetical protein